jgi:1,4-alpha-glucan branching enzyme
MSLKKQYHKKDQTCKVTFCLPKEAAHAAKKVYLVGEFNNWELYETPMKKLKDGSFSATIELASGKEYQFRYFIDDATWENDWAADKYIHSSHGNCENSVVVV